MRIVSVVGARPNFMKLAPFSLAVKRHNFSSDHKIEHVIVHTGQHYDTRMSENFFRQLDIPEPDINLCVGSGTHAEQVGKTMIEFEKVLRNIQPDWVIVVGDVNAALAGAVTAKKENIKCCHIEAGLRSGDLSMPEEINRLIIDRISDLLLTPDVISLNNLIAEGVGLDKIKFVGNIMIDALEMNRGRASSLDLLKIIEENRINQFPEIMKSGFTDFAIVTLHRPSNVDSPLNLSAIAKFLKEEASGNMTILWTIHPRTGKALKELGIWNELINSENLVLLEPLGYLELLKLNMEAKIVITDSGGLQEECTILGTPCITLRENTERPVTLSENGGVSVLTGNDIGKVRVEFSKAIIKPRKPFRPDLWDGKTAERCLDIILKYNL